MKRILFIILLLSMIFASPIEDQVNMMLKTGETAKYSNVDLPTTGNSYTIVNINDLPYFVFDSNDAIVNDSDVINEALIVDGVGVSISADISKLISNLTEFNKTYQESAWYTKLTGRYDKSGCLEFITSPSFLNLYYTYGPEIMQKGNNVSYYGAIIENETNNSINLALKMNSTANGAPYATLDSDVTKLISNINTINESIPFYTHNCSALMYGDTTHVSLNTTHLSNALSVANSLKSVSSSAVSSASEVINRTNERLYYARIHSLILNASKRLNETKRLAQAVLANVQIDRIANLSQAADNKLSQLQSTLLTNTSAAEAMLTDFESLINNLNFTSSKILNSAVELNKFVTNINSAKDELNKAYKKFGEQDDRLVTIKNRLKELETIKQAYQSKLEDYQSVDMKEITAYKDEAVNITSTLKTMKPKEMELDIFVVLGVVVILVFIVGFIMHKRRKKVTM